MSLIKTIWIAPFMKEDTDSDGNTIFEYDTPFSINVSLNSLNGNYEIALYGEKVTRMCKCMPNLEMWNGRIKEGDRAYLYGATPVGEVNIGDNANYIVKSTLPQNVKLAVYFERL